MPQINIAELISEFGDYYLGRNGQGNMSRLRKKAYMRSFTNQFCFTRTLTDGTVYQASETRFRSVLQQFQVQHTPRPGELKFVPIVIPLRHMKVDEDLSPYDLMGNWAEFLSTAGPDGSALDPKSFPLIAWFLEEHLFPMLQEDWELEAVYKGTHVAPTAGTPGNPNEVVDGIEKKCDDLVLAGRMAPFVMGATPTGVGANEQMVEYVYDFSDQYDEVVKPRNSRRTKNIFAMSPDNAKKFLRGLDKVENGNYEKVKIPETIQDEEGEPIMVKVPHTVNNYVVGLDSMEGKDRIWATPKVNAVFLEHRAPNFERVMVESDKRIVAMFTDFWKGIGFDIPELVCLTDVA